MEMCSTSLTLHTQYLELIKQREHQRPSEERVLFNVPQQGTNSVSCEAELLGGSI